MSAAGKPRLRGVFHLYGFVVFAVLGAVFLAVTGGEAMYADMGHFGRFPIRLAWFAIALPALVLNYLGQAALIAVDASAIDNPVVVGDRGAVSRCSTPFSRQIRSKSTSVGG